jgi:hypothetical protein
MCAKKLATTRRIKRQTFFTLNQLTTITNLLWRMSFYIKSRIYSRASLYPALNTKVMIENSMWRKLMFIFV